MRRCLRARGKSLAARGKAKHGRGGAACKQWSRPWPGKLYQRQEAGFGRGTSRRTSFAGLSSRRPSYTTCRSRLSSVQVRNFTSATSSGRTQCTRLSRSGDPKRLPRGGGTVVYEDLREDKPGAELRRSPPYPKL